YAGAFAGDGRAGLLCLSDEAFGGPNLGWTKTSVAVSRVDPVTELEFVEWQKNFVPGLDFLGGVGALAGVLFAVSFLAKNPVNRSQSNP
ncbi:MAG: hypothetical protein AB7O66_15855, partial [Limisphaerales bacterium]